MIVFELSSLVDTGAIEFDFGNNWAEGLYMQVR